MWYRRTQHDWFGFEAAQKEVLAEKMSEGVLAGKIARNRIVAFILLSVKDPFLAFAYYQGRSGGRRSFNGVDWLIFFISNAIGILFWILLLALVSEAVGTWVLYGIGLVGLLFVFWNLIKKPSAS